MFPDGTIRGNADVAINAYMLGLYEKYRPLLPKRGRAVSFGYPSAHHDIEGDFKERLEADGLPSDRDWETR